MLAVKTQAKIFVFFCVAVLVVIVIHSTGRLSSDFSEELGIREYSRIDNYISEKRSSSTRSTNVDCERHMRVSFNRKNVPARFKWETPLINPKMKFCNVCSEYFGYGYLKRWIGNGHKYCEGSVSNLICFSLNHKYSPPKTYPHTVCHGRNILLDFGKLKKTLKLKHRPTYWKGTDPIYFTAEESAIVGACSLHNSFNLDLFSRDMARDLFAGFTGRENSDIRDLRNRAVSIQNAILVTREGEEYRNLFHATTDMLLAFSTARMLGVSTLNSTLVLLDGNPVGPFDFEGWKNIFSRGNDIVRGGSEYEKKSRILFNKVAFVPPGYSSFLYSFLDSDNICTGPSRLVLDFANTLLRVNQIGHDTSWFSTGDTHSLKITIVARKPSRQYPKIDRQFQDLSGLVRDIKKRVEKTVIDGVAVEPTVESYDFALLPFKKQLQIIARTDIFIGTHGAALTHVLYLPMWGGLVEIFPYKGQRWRCFENMAIWTGKGYTRYNAPANSHVATSTGDAVKVDMDKLGPILDKMVNSVVFHRIDYLKSVNCRADEELRKTVQNREIINN